MKLKAKMMIKYKKMMESKRMIKYQAIKDNNNRINKIKKHKRLLMIKVKMKLLLSMNK